jgi:cation transport ATPase
MREAARACGRRWHQRRSGSCRGPSRSPSSAAELAQARADAVFLGLQLAPMLDATTARKARSLMRQNLILAMIYNMFATRIAVIALVTPLIAAILSEDDFSELQ